MSGGPYRDSGGDQPAEAPRDEGIVGDVIAQFADIHAFYRELVQNSIDAGSPSIEVELDYDRDAQRMNVSVKDRGEGMTRDIVENQLLVLFRSTKEKDKSKIGKFGIGFASVLAPNPEVVKVHTVRDKRRLTLHLYRDLSYELFDAGPATQNGTTVTLELAMKPDAVKEFVHASRSALRRWCRHATVPIEFWETRADGRGGERIDGPLEIGRTLAEVRETTDAGQLTVVVGIGGMPTVGFYNHGLTLYETSHDMLLGNIAAKIQDARLGHTISRDDVRRDEHFDRAVSFAREVANTKLAAEAARKLKEYAEAKRVEDVAALVEAVADAKLELPAWPMPLVEPVLGATTLDVSRVHKVWASRHSTPLTEDLARLGQHVILAKDVERLASHLERPTGVKIREVHGELTSIKPVERSERDEALLGTLLSILDKVYRNPGAIVLADLVGLHADRFAISGLEEGAHVVSRDDAAKNPFALLGRRPLVLSIAHPLVQAARAHDDPRLAAAHLARAVLLHHRLLDFGRSQEILDLALEQTGLE
ncbi:MAG TPA: ATP-binding protein [Kofleriaceae bacterium]|nr:ATP-binding protein [Kofleriaceae bacterium]